MNRLVLEDNWAEIIFEGQQYPVIKLTVLTSEEYNQELRAVASWQPPDSAWVERLLEDTNSPVITNQTLTREEYNEEVRAMLGIKGEMFILDNTKIVLSKVS